MVYLYRHYVGLSQSLYNKIFDDVKLERACSFVFLNNLHGYISVSQYSHGPFVNCQIYWKNTDVKNLLHCVGLCII